MLLRQSLDRIFTFQYIIFNPDYSQGLKHSFRNKPKPSNFPQNSLCLLKNITNGSVTYWPGHESSYFEAVPGHQVSVYTFPCLIQVRHILQHDHIKYKYSVTTISAFKIH
jgi:hypothetical protein